MRPPLSARRGGKLPVERAIRRWHPFDPVLISTPDDTVLRPPICIQAYAADLHARMLKRYAALIIGLAILLGFIGAAYLLGADKVDKLLKMAMSTSLILMFFCLDKKLILDDLQAVQERTLFTVWVYRNGFRSAVIAALVMVAVAACQFVLQSKLHGLEPTIEAWGTVFSAPTSEFWRYVIGPFLHSGIAHWVSNTALLIVSAALVGSVGGRVWILLLLTSTLSAWLCRWIPMEYRSEALVGISGGIYGLYGWLIGISARQPSRFPKHFAVSITLFVAMTIGFSSLLNPRTNDFVHLTGGLIGCMLGLGRLGRSARSFVS